MMRLGMGDVKFDSVSDHQQYTCCRKREFPSSDDDGGRDIKEKIARAGNNVRLLSEPDVAALAIRER